MDGMDGRMSERVNRGMSRWRDGRERVGDQFNEGRIFFPRNFAGPSFLLLLSRCVLLCIPPSLVSISVDSSDPFMAIGNGLF